MKRCALASLQEGRYLEKGCTICLLQELPLGLAADGATEAQNPEVLPEDPGPGHDKHALLPENVACQFVHVVTALQGQRPCLWIHAARLQQQVLPVVLAIDDVFAIDHLLGLLPFFQHQAYDSGRTGVAEHATQLVRRNALLQVLCDLGCHFAQFLVGVNKRFIWLLINDKGIDLVQDQHPLLVMAEVPCLGARNARIERLHVLCFAIADVRIGVDAGNEAACGGARACGRQPLLGDTQHGVDIPLCAVLSLDLESVEQGLEGGEVTLEQCLVVDYDVHPLPQCDDDIYGQSGNDHALALAGADLRNQGSDVVHGRGVCPLVADSLEEAAEGH
mmetsp:Transcript_77595/g.225182  ORF Transcript_77595/g.225182 Transcript_77595/m.225182 type:complete len:333 (-) Transcript_77595:3063-4061(-)